MQTEIGPYQVLEPVDVQAAVQVYRAVHRGPRGFSRMCTLKVVSTSRAGLDANRVADVVTQAHLCARLHAPSIEGLYDFFETEHQLVLVHENHPGLELAELMTWHRDEAISMPLERVCYIALRLFEALAAAHALVDDDGNSTPVVHRDIRPEHLHLSASGDIRLGGFAIATVEHAVTSAIGRIVTARGSRAGTPSYLAPEVARGAGHTVRSDLFSAALIVWELLFNRCATRLDIQSEGEFLDALATRRLPSLRESRRGIPADIVHAIDTCLQPRPEARSFSAGHVINALCSYVRPQDARRELQFAVRVLCPQARRASIRPVAAPAAPAAPAEKAPASKKQAPEATPAPPVTAAARTGSRLSMSSLTGISNSLFPPGMNQKDRTRSLLAAAAGFLLVAGAPALRFLWDGPTVDPTIDPTVAPAVASAVASATASQLADAPLREPGAALPSASSAPAASTPPNPYPPPPPTTPVLGHQTRVFIDGADGHAYIHGVAQGPTETWLDVPCGLKHVRIGVQSRRGIDWKTPGRAVYLRCGQVGRLDAQKGGLRAVRDR